MIEDIKVVNREKPDATIEVNLADWPHTSAKNIGTIRAGAGWEIHVPTKVNPFEVAKELVFDVNPSDDPGELKLVIIQDERKWGPLFVEESDRIHVVFREIADEDDMNYGWEGEFEPASHYLCAGVIASYGCFTSGGAPFSSSRAGAILDLDGAWIEIRQDDFAYSHSIVPSPDNPSFLLAAWIRKNSLEPLFLVMNTDCKWTDDESREAFDEARETVSSQLSNISLHGNPELIPECIENLVLENPALESIRDAISGEFSPVSAIVFGALESASEEESAHPIFELEWKIANA